MDNKKRLKVSIVGAGGRMGHEIALSAMQDDFVEIVGAVDRDPSATGKVYFPVHGVEIEYAATVCTTTDLVDACKNAEVIIDFSGAGGTVSNIENYRELKKPLVIGSTGFTSKQKESVLDLSKSLPLLLASNMSLGVNLLLGLAEKASKILTADEYDIEISEIHHRHKKDSPSGTSLSLGEAVAKGRGVLLEDVAVYSRHGANLQRKQGDIGFQSLRGGEVAGDHTVHFFAGGEVIELTHKAINRSTFAKGALRAAKWISNKKLGLYSMQDVLGLR